MKPAALLTAAMLTVAACAPPTPPTVEASPASAPTNSTLDDLMPRTDLQSALDRATEFAGEYVSHRQAESAADYLARLRPLVTDDLHQALYRTRRHRRPPAQAGPRQVREIRRIADDSVTVVVTVGIENTPRLEILAVTVVRQPGTWKVHDVQPADSGNPSDPS